MDTNEFMRDLEQRYQQRSGLTDRSMYKIYYCQVSQAPVLALGVNPGGDPQTVAPDGQKAVDGSGDRHAASTAFYEKNEHDLLDCAWRENNVVGLLAELLGNATAVREKVVKTNIAFRRSPKKHLLGRYHHGMTMEDAMKESAPFLDEIISVVNPRLVMLTGVKLQDFAAQHCRKLQHCIPEPERDSRVRQTVFDAAEASLANDTCAIVAQVAHASKFSWTYSRYNVAERILKLTGPLA